MEWHLPIMESSRWIEYARWLERLTVEQALAHQLHIARLASFIRAPFRSDVRVVAGMDCTFLESKKETIGIACVVVFDLEGWQVLEQQWAVGEVRFPYVPGLLAFRELPLLLEAFARIGTGVDLLLVDGHGRAHPRRAGIAVHTGVVIGVPSMGCAKGHLCGEWRMPPNQRGAHSPLMVNGEQVGWVVRTRAGAKPVFVSEGWGIALEAIPFVIMRMVGRYRLPEPVRLAHQLCSRLRTLAGKDSRSAGR